MWRRRRWQRRRWQRRRRRASPRRRLAFGRKRPAPHAPPHEPALRASQPKTARARQGRYARGGGERTRSGLDAVSQEGLPLGVGGLPAHPCLKKKWAGKQKLRDVHVFNQIIGKPGNRQPKRQNFQEPLFGSLCETENLEFSFENKCRRQLLVVFVKLKNRQPPRKNLAVLITQCS